MKYTLFSPVRHPELVSGSLAAVGRLTNSKDAELNSAGPQEEGISHPELVSGSITKE